MHQLFDAGLHRVHTMLVHVCTELYRHGCFCAEVFCLMFADMAGSKCNKMGCSLCKSP